ncbi:MAG: radical SAM protein [Elusimicrobiales bacterium]|nr:radical SAM protein [Elusimicrobiales bacterium]
MLKRATTRVALVWPGGLDPRRVLPLAYACLAANTPKELCEFRLFDLALGAPAPERLEAELAAFAPEVVGLSCFAMNFPQALAAARAAKKAAPGAVVIAGGQHPSSWPEGVLAHNEIDFVLKGEGERAFAAFLEQFRSAAPDWGKVPGLARRGPHGLLEAPPAMVEDLDSLALPDYRFINFAEYLRRGYRVYADSRPSAPIQTTRGCPYACAFCCGPAISGSRLRRFSADYAMRWIEALNRDFGVLWFNIIDDNFTFHPEAAKEFCREALKLRLPGLRFGTPNGIRAQHGDAQLWRLMAAAGWDHFTVAPESGSERVLELMRKDLKPAQIEAAVAGMRATGLPVCGFFILGYPGETREDLALTLNMVKLFDLAELFVFQPLPGSPVFRELRAAGRIPADFIPAVGDFSSGERSYVSEELRGVNFYRLIFLARLGVALRHPLTALAHLRHLDLPVAAAKVFRQAAAFLAGRE